MTALVEAALQGIHDLPLFIAAGLLLNITPGVDMALVAARSAMQGWRSGAAAALGVGAGCALHTLAVGLGLAALLAQSAATFAALRWLGAVYLVWLGVAIWRSARAQARTAWAAREAADVQARTALGKSFVQGFLTNALNPKVALFFLAFLPQFVSTSAPSEVASLLLLGLVFVINGTLVNLAFAVLVAGLKRRLSVGAGAAAWLGRAMGGLFIGLGLKLALDAPR